MSLRNIPVAGWYPWILVLSFRDTLIRAPLLPTGPSLRRLSYSLVLVIARSLYLVTLRLPFFEGFRRT